MTNTNELTAKLKAAAKNAKYGYFVLQEFIDIANPANILALTEALEAAESRIADVKARVKAAEKRYENRTPTEWAYGQACAAIENHRARADAAEARIAELEARTLTVKLPGAHHVTTVIDKNIQQAFVNGEALGRKEVLNAFKVSLTAAGIKLQIEGE